MMADAEGRVDMKGYQKAVAGMLFTAIAFGAASGLLCGLGGLVAWLLSDVTGLLAHPQQAVIAFGATLAISSVGLAIYFGYRVASTAKIWIMPGAIGNVLVAGAAGAIGSGVTVFNYVNAFEASPSSAPWYLVSVEVVVVILGFIAGARMRMESGEELPRFRGFVMPEEREREQ